MHQVVCVLFACALWALPGCGGNLTRAQRCRIGAAFSPDDTVRAIRMSECTQIEAIESAERMHAERMELERKRQADADEERIRRAEERAAARREKLDLAWAHVNEQRTRECLKLADSDKLLEFSENRTLDLLGRVYEAQDTAQSYEEMQRLNAMELELVEGLQKARHQRLTLRQYLSCPELPELTAAHEALPTP